MTIKQSETIIIKRSQINFAPYNPRVEDQRVVDTIRRNFKSVGFLGGIAWNNLTGNLIAGHKRLKALDILNGYDGSIEKDYDVKVESIDLDEKTEREQNVFMNADSAQGVFDMKALAQLLPEIDYKNAGLTDSDIEMIAFEVPGFAMGNAADIMADIFTTQEPIRQQRETEKQENKQEREQIRLQNKEDQRQQKQEMREKRQFECDVKQYVTISFSSAENKMAFMNRFGFETNAEFIKGEVFSDMIERTN